MLKNKISLKLFLSLLMQFNIHAHAAEWSFTELTYKHGQLVAPEFAGGDDAATHIYSLRHASGWGFGDVFFFIDALNDNQNDGFNDHDLYGELYVNFSLGKLLSHPLSFGFVKDVGILAGFNAAKDAKVRKYLPGGRLSWEVPGFSFLNTDFMAYLDDSAGVQHGGAPKETDSFLIDANWQRPFSIGTQSFSIEGHIEYAGNRRNEFGNAVSYHVLAQPQFRWDAGKGLGGKANQIFVGVEHLYWRNKLGEKHTNESRPQFLAVLHF